MGLTQAQGLVLPAQTRTPMGRWGFLKEISLDGMRRATGGTTVKALPGVVRKIRSDVRSDAAVRGAESGRTYGPGFLVAPDDAILAHHYAALTDYLHITLADAAEQPIVIRHSLGGNAALHTLIEARQGAEAVVVEILEGDAGTTTHVVEASLADGAQVTYLTINTQCGTTLATRHAVAGRDAQMSWFALDVSPGKVRSRVTTVLGGEGAGTRNHNIFLGAQGSRLDFGAEARHEAPHTTSSLFTKGALQSGSSAIYEGVLSIAHSAPKSDAFQREECLLLAPDAISKASPRLFIGNNDVRCSHAVTTTRPDETLLFYLRSRGLDERTARGLLLRAFVWPVLEDLDVRSRTVLEPLLLDALVAFDAEDRAVVSGPQGRNS